MAAKKERQDLEAEVWNAITAFEQILEAMPSDRASLEALSHAYEQIGDLTKSKEYLIRLGSVLLEEGDARSASGLLEKLEVFADDEEASALLAKIKDAAGGVDVSSGTGAGDILHGVAGIADEADKPKKKKVIVSTAFNMSEELAMAWNLMEAGELTQEEYASVVQDLTEMSAGDSVSTISVLHVLEARGFKSLERIVVYLVRSCGTPFVALANFDLTVDAAAVLPTDFSVRRGAIVYDILGHDALAVVMNPYDKQLRKDVETLAERKCHFYLTLPSDFDRAAEKAEEMLAEKREEEAAAAAAAAAR